MIESSFPRPRASSPPIGSTQPFAAVLPRYIRIAETLQARIQSGEYAVDTFLPAEGKLAHEFGVSRGTIRQSTNVLQERGFLRAEVGRGTRVLAQQTPGTVLTLHDFTDDILRSGRIPTTRLLERVVIPAPREVAVRLRVAAGSKVIRLTRLRLADELPLVYETRYLALSTCPELLQEDVERQSVHQLLLERYHIPLVRVDLSVRRTLPPAQVARALGLASGDLVFCLDRVTYRDEREPVTWFRAYYHSNHFDLTVHH